jgi:hypothetical protein
MKLLAFTLLTCAYALISLTADSEHSNAQQFTDPECSTVTMETMPLEELLLQLDPAWMLPSTPEERVREYLKRSPWPRWLHAQALAVIACESTYNPNAIGDDGLAFGLLQIRTDYHPQLALMDLLDPQQNLLAAYVIYLQAGRSWSPWSCQP